MLVPVFFIILRVWTLALTIEYVYLHPGKAESIPTYDYWLFYVGVSEGGDNCMCALHQNNITVT